MCLLEGDEKGPGRVPDPDDGPGNHTGQSRSSQAVASELRSEPLNSSGQDVGDDTGGEGVPVLRPVAPSHTWRIDRHDEIAACREMTGHAERAVLARDVEVEVPAIHPTARNTHPQQRGRTDTRGHKEVGRDLSAASGRDGAHIHGDAGPAYGKRLGSHPVPSTDSECSCPTLNDALWDEPSAAYVAPSATRHRSQPLLTPEKSSPDSLWA